MTDTTLHSRPRRHTPTAQNDPGPRRVHILCVVQCSVTLPECDSDAGAMADALNIITPERLFDALNETIAATPSYRVEIEYNDEIEGYLVDRGPLSTTNDNYLHAVESREFYCEHGTICNIGRPTCLCGKEST